MDSANQSWALMSLMALTLGVKHGFDLDHLATIDAITRTLRERRRLSKLVGFLFSLGHGFVVIAISLVIGSGIMQSHVPEWLDAVGSWISITFLFVFGLLNLWNVLRSSSSHHHPVGLKSFLAKRLVRGSFSPLMILSIGALFAISFDTFSQIALFSISASMVAGWIFSFLLGLFFMFGMMLSDGINGYLVSTLIQRSDKWSMLFSRGLGLAIALFSLSIGSIALYKIWIE